MLRPNHNAQHLLLIRLAFSGTSFMLTTISVLTVRLMIMTPSAGLIETVGLSETAGAAAVASISCTHTR